MKKLAIVSSHPIQYNAPFFKLLSERGKLSIKVFYTWSQSIDKVKDNYFGKHIKWDISLLEGYEYENIFNSARVPGTKKLFGFKNSDLIPAIDRYSPDSVLVYGWFLWSHFNVMRYYKGKVPVLFRGDSTLLDEGQNIKTLCRRIFLKKVYSYIDYAFYVGTNNREYFLKHGVDERKLIFAPHSVDNKRFSFSPENEVKKRRDQFGYKNSDILILYAGKFYEKKSIVFLINALKSLNNAISNPLKLLLVGDGEAKPLIEVKIANDQNFKIIEFQNQSRMPYIYSLCDIFCLPSKSETWGLSVNEAMASGRAVLVSSKAGCAVDLVKSDLNGWIFESENFEDLKLRLTLISKLSREKILEMGRHSFEVIKDWNFQKNCLAIENLLSS